MARRIIAAAGRVEAACGEVVPCRRMWKRLLMAAVLALSGACGDDDKKPAATTITVEPTPRDAVAEVKLQLEDFRSYYYCELSYPKTCDDLPVAYVLEQAEGEPFRIVFFNNQDVNSTFAQFDYLTIDMATKTISVEGQFQWCNRCSATAGYEEKGTPMWGVPK